MVLKVKVAETAYNLGNPQYMSSEIRRCHDISLRFWPFLGIEIFGVSIESESSTDVK